MRQPSWSGWASIRSSLPSWAGVPLLVAVVIMASLGWVLLARGMFPADGTVTFPSAPYWSERGVVINKLQSGVSGLRVGDCVVAVDGRPLEDLVRNGPVRNYKAGDVIRYDVRRSDAPLDRDCSGSLVSVEVALTAYPFGSVLRQHASVLLLASFMLALGAFLVAVRPRSGAPGALLAAGCFYLFGRTAWPFGIQVVDLANGPRLWPFVIGETAIALFWGALLLMAASLPRQSLPPRKLVVGCFVVPLALHLPYSVLALRQTSELGKLARLVTVSFGAAHVIPILMVLALVVGYRSVGQPEKRAAVRWVVIPFTLLTLAYLGLGKLPTALTGRPLIPWIWFRGLFILVLAAMAVAVVRNHLFEVQIVVRRWGLRIIALVSATAGVLVLWRLLIMPRTQPADWLMAAAAGVLIAALCVTIVLLNRVLQRRFFGARADSDVMIAALSPRTTPVVTDESGLVAILDALMNALRLAFVRLDLTMPGMTPLSVSRGASRQPDRVMPLYAGRVHVGQLSLAGAPGSGAARASRRATARCSWPRTCQQCVQPRSTTGAAEGASPGSDCKGGGAPPYPTRDPRRHRPIAGGSAPTDRDCHGPTARRPGPGRLFTEAPPPAEDRAHRRPQSGGRTPPTSPRPRRPGVCPPAACRTKRRNGRRKLPDGCIRDLR